MTIVATLLEAASDTNAGELTDVVTGSVSPNDAKEHFMALVIGRSTAQAMETPAVTGAGLTWVDIHEIDFHTAADPTRRLILYRGTGTPTPGALTISTTNSFQVYLWSIFDLEGVDETNPDVEIATDIAEAGASSLTIGDLTDFSDTPTDGTLLVFSRTGTGSMSIESGWTQLSSDTESTPGLALLTGYRADPDVQAIVTIGGTAALAGFVVRLNGTGSVSGGGGTATQNATYMRESERLIARAGRIAGRLQVRRRSGIDIASDLTSLRAIVADILAKRDDFMSDATDIQAELTQLGLDRDALLAVGGDPGTPAPTPVALLKGLMTRENASGLSASVEHWNPNIGWDDLQPTEGGAIDTSVIDDVIADGASFRARIFNGHRAPQWLKDIVGTVSIVPAQTPTDPAKNVMRYWDPVVLDYYDDFMQKLAAIYDGVFPLIFEALCMVIYAEPCLKQASNTSNRTNLVAAGYTNAADLAAFNGALDIMASHWHETRVGVAYNGYQLINSAGTGISTSFAQTKALMQRQRQLFGERAVIQNNSIRSSYISNPSQLYDDIVELGPPTSFQTATSGRIGDAAATLQWALDMGAHAVELPSGYSSLLTAQELADFDALLRANP